MKLRLRLPGRTMPHPPSCGALPDLTVEQVVQVGHRHPHSVELGGDKVDGAVGGGELSWLVSVVATS